MGLLAQNDQLLQEDMLNVVGTRADRARDAQRAIRHHLERDERDDRRLGRQHDADASNEHLGQASCLPRKSLVDPHIEPCRAL